MSYPIKTKKPKASQDPVAASAEQIAASREGEHWQAIGAGENLTTWHKVQPDWRKVDLSHYRKAKPHGNAGTKQHRAKLAETDIPDILQMHSRGASCVEIAKRYGVSGTSVSSIVRGDTWKHVDRGVYAGKRSSTLKAKGEKHGMRRLSEASVRSVRAAYRRGEGMDSIANEFGVSKTAVWNVLNGTTWKHVPDYCDPISIRPAGVARALTTKDASAIRSQYAGGISVAALARDHGVSRRTIHNIVQKKTYNRVARK